MTTIELASRLARRLTKRSLPALSMPAAMDLLEAINAGLQECYQLLPSWQRRTTVSIELAAPLVVSLSVTNGSVDLGDGGSQFLETQVGRSVVVAGDANWNEVQSTAKLLDAYEGETGVHSATIYGDSAYNDFATFDGLASHPRLADSRSPLTLYNARAAGEPAAVGQPRYYWLEPAAASLAAQVPVYLRVHPAPDVAYVLRVDMEFRPVRLTYASLQSASAIPLPDQLLERALIPLCEVRLLRSPEWADRSLQQLVLADADAARGFLANQRPTAGVPNNRVGTPAGY